MGSNCGTVERSDQTASPHLPSVFVIDDDQQLLDSLVALLEARDFRVHAFSSASGFLRYYRAEMPGCLVLDVRMPRQNGIHLYEQLVREGKRLPVIFMSAHADVPMAVSAMKSGAIEFLEKPFDGATLLECVRKALQCDAEWRRRDARYESIAERIRRLNQRERETLDLIHAGESNKSMAAKLFLSERAVELRRSGIMRKLQVCSVAELLDLTITHRILTELRQTAAERHFR